MRRVDGTWVVYQVELSKGGRVWHQAGDAITGRIPADMRFVTPPGHDGKLKEPFYSFSSCGQTWQETGLHGSYTKEPAVALKGILERHVTEYQYRVVELKVSQSLRVVCGPGAEEGRETPMRPEPMAGRTTLAHPYPGLYWSCLCGERPYLTRGPKVTDPSGRIITPEACFGCGCHASLWGDVVFGQGNMWAPHEINVNWGKQT